jgi:hypothetical protein
MKKWKDELDKVTYGVTSPTETVDNTTSHAMRSRFSTSTEALSNGFARTAPTGQFNGSHSNQRMMTGVILPSSVRRFP